MGGRRGAGRGRRTDQEKGKKYNCEVPEEVLYLTAGVDTQDDRFEIEVVGWGPEYESWGHKIRRSLRR